MSEDSGATPNPSTPTGATPTNPNPAAPTQPATQGATPVITPDTHAEITRLKSELESVKAHNDLLKKENIEKRQSAKIADDDRAALTAFRELGETPEKLKATIETGTAAITERDGMKREKLNADAAAILKLKPSALSAKWLGEGVPVIEPEKDEKGADVQRVYVQTGDEKVAWDKFVEANPELKDVIPALAAEQPAAPGTPHVRQDPGGPREAKPIDEDAARQSQAGLYNRF